MMIRPEPVQGENEAGKKDIVMAMMKCFYNERRCNKKKRGWDGCLCRMRRHQGHHHPERLYKHGPKK